MELLGQRDQEPDEIGPVHELRPQAEDETSKVPDGVMQRVDRAIHAGPGFLRVVGHQLGHVFQ